LPFNLPEPVPIASPSCVLAIYPIVILRPRDVSLFNGD
jgi:hypothetical protein